MLIYIYISHYNGGEGEKKGNEWVSECGEGERRVMGGRGAGQRL